MKEDVSTKMDRLEFNYHSIIEKLVKRTNCYSFSLIYDGWGLDRLIDPLHPYILQDQEKEAEKPQGIKCFPVIYSCPLNKDPLEPWNLVSIILSKYDHLRVGEFLWDSDSEARTGISYFLTRVDQRMIVAVTFITPQLAATLAAQAAAQAAQVNDKQQDKIVKENDTESSSSSSASSSSNPNSSISSSTASFTTSSSAASTSTSMISLLPASSSNLSSTSSQSSGANSVNTTTPVSSAATAAANAATLNQLAILRRKNQEILLADISQLTHRLTHLHVFSQLLPHIKKK